jgi:Flp pilus assembly pilin Flp
MEGEPGSSAIEWVIRLALVSLALAAVWTVFGDDIAQFLGR